MVLPIGASQSPSLARHADQPVVLGIRPEHVQVAHETGVGTGQARVAAVVELCEPLGNEVLLHARAGGHAVIARTPARCLSEPGQPVGLAFDLAFAFGPPIPKNGGPAITLPDGQIFNLDLSTVSWLCPGGPTPCFTGSASLGISAPPAGLVITGQVVAFDPAFATNGWVYVYYTATTPTIHNRLSRFTASGDVAVAGSEQILFELPPLSTAPNHNGGALHFGPDGKLYVAVGDNARARNGQDMTTILGKVLRLNRDGSIPTDNPFYSTTTGQSRAIFALGFAWRLLTTRCRRRCCPSPRAPHRGLLDLGDVGRPAAQLARRPEGTPPRIHAARAPTVRARSGRSPRSAAAAPPRSSRTCRTPTGS